MSAFSKLKTRGARRVACAIVGLAIIASACSLRWTCFSVASAESAGRRLLEAAEQCDEAAPILRMYDVFPNEWDSLIVLPPYVDELTAWNAIGAVWPNLFFARTHDDCAYLIVLLRGSIVVECVELAFVRLDVSRLGAFVRRNRSESIFRVFRRPDGVLALEWQ